MAGLFDGGEGYEDYFCMRYLCVPSVVSSVLTPGQRASCAYQACGFFPLFFLFFFVQMFYFGSGTGHTLALAINSFMTGLPLCSRVSSTSVRGLALSRRLSSFWKSNRLCDRRWACAEGAMVGKSSSCSTRGFLDDSSVSVLYVSTRVSSVTTLLLSMRSGTSSDVHAKSLFLGPCSPRLPALS